MLTESIERFIIRTVEKGAPSPSPLLGLTHFLSIYPHLTVGNRERKESLAPVTGFGKHFPTCCIIEGNTTVTSIYDGFHGGCSHHYPFPLLMDSETGISLLWDDDQACFLRESIFCRCLHADDLVVDHLKADLPGTFICLFLHWNGNHVSLFRVVSGSRNNTSLHPQGNHQNHLHFHLSSNFNRFSFAKIVVFPDNHAKPITKDCKRSGRKMPYHTSERTMPQQPVLY